MYRQLLGAANEFKEGDAIVGVAAANDQARARARQLLTNTRLADLTTHPPWEDSLSKWNDQFVQRDRLNGWNNRTLGQLKQTLLSATPAEIHSLVPGLNSDVIASVVRLMSNDELIAVGKTVFHPLGGSRIGAKGYLGAGFNRIRRLIIRMTFDFKSLTHSPTPSAMCC